VEAVGMSNHPLDPITRAIAKPLATLLKQGVEPPIYLVAVASNGSMLYVRYASDDAGGFRANALAGHLGGSGFVLPINLVFTDKKGNAYRGVLGSGG
jgi:hypothetical protein